MYEILLKFIPGPLYCMVNLIWVQFESADLESLFFRVSGVGLRLCCSWDHNLHVWFDTLGARINKRFWIEYTFFINKISGFDIVYCVENDILWVPKCVILNIFCVFGHNLPLCFNIETCINLFGFSACNFTFELCHICIPKQKLSIQITNFNTIVISTLNFTITWTS